MQSLKGQRKVVPNFHRKHCWIFLQLPIFFHVCILLTSFSFVCFTQEKIPTEDSGEFYLSRVCGTEQLVAKGQDAVHNLQTSLRQGVVLEMAIAERILVMHISHDVLIKSPWIQHICTGWCVTCCTNIGKIWRGQKWGRLWWSSGSSTELIFVFISSVVISQDPQPELFIRFAFPSFAFSFLYSFIPYDPFKISSPTMLFCLHKPGPLISSVSWDSQTPPVS